MIGPLAGKKLILVVEDEPDNREIMRAVVEDLCGHEALLVEDGEAAVRAALARPPSMILMDLMVPVMDGFEVIRALKAAEPTAHIPIIAVTALSRPLDIQHVLHEGAADYLSKPFDLDVLIGLIERYVGDTNCDGKQPSA